MYCMPAFDLTRAAVMNCADCAHAVLKRCACHVDVCAVQTPIKDSQAASKAILALEGVVDHGLFLDMVDVCIIAGTNGVEVQERKN